MAVSLLAALGRWLLENAGDRGVDGVPLVQQSGENLFALRREAIEALVAFFLFAPFTEEQALGLEPAEERVKRTLVDLEAALVEVLAQRVAVVFPAELG